MDITMVQNAALPGPAFADAVATHQLARHRDLIQAVRTVNAGEMLGQDNELTFQMDRETRRPILRIVSRKTNEVIEQVPPEYVLRMAEELRKLERD
ncbi:MAG: flagellar protein FlaG [Bryobacteraceae bacterium]